MLKITSVLFFSALVLGMLNHFNIMVVNFKPSFCNAPPVGEAKQKVT